MSEPTPAPPYAGYDAGCIKATAGSQTPICKEQASAPVRQDCVLVRDGRGCSVLSSQSVATLLGQSLLTCYPDQPLFLT